MFGMSEEQFWRSNPRIIKVWENAWKEKQKRENEKAHMYSGQYLISALIFSIDHCLNGHKARSKYMEKPVQLFPLTEEEKERERQKAVAQFMEWAESQNRIYRKEE